jgi:hypothetical protein
MDEAQNYVRPGGPPDAAGARWPDGQARKYGLGLLFATQHPRGLHNSIPGKRDHAVLREAELSVQISAARELAAAKNGNVDDTAG